MLTIGDELPEFEVVGVKPGFMRHEENGESAFETITKESFEGKWKVIYFYPKDDTPGCTKEACNFRDQWQLFDKNEVKVLGISKDNASSHTKFISKHSLPFTLLTDIEPCEVACLYES